MTREERIDRIAAGFARASDSRMRGEPDEVVLDQYGDGARPLARAILDVLEDVVAEQIRVGEARGIVAHAEALAPDTPTS